MMHVVTSGCVSESAKDVEWRSSVNSSSIVFGVLPGKLKSPQMMRLSTASIPRVVTRFANSARIVDLVCSGSVVVTAYDFESGRPGSNPEWGLIYYKASITAQGLPEPSSLRGSTLGTRTAEHKGCNWACTLTDGCSLKSCMCSATPSVASSGICHRNKSQLNCMQRLCDWVKRRSISVSYIYIYICIADGGR